MVGSYKEGPVTQAGATATATMATVTGTTARLEFSLALAASVITATFAIGDSTNS